MGARYDSLLPELLLTGCSDVQATSTGQLNTILTFYEITDPPIDSAMSGVPLSLLRRAISILAKTGRAQILEGADGGGVRFFPASGKT